jgi:hypothetical protein
MFMTSVGLDGTGGDRVHDFDVRNNVWVDIALQGNIGIPNLRFSNNTLINVGRANGFALYFGPAVYSVATGAEITNNLFVDPGGQSGTSAAAAYTIRQGSGYRIDHNYVTRGPAHGWAALSGFAEAHGVNGGDPRFVDLARGDYHLTPTSAAIGAGATLGFGDDADGAPRTVPWDIGAYESRTGVAALDAGALDALDPDVSASEGTDVGASGGTDVGASDALDAERADVGPSESPDVGPPGDAASRGQDLGHPTPSPPTRVSCGCAAGDRGPAQEFALLSLLVWPLSRHRARGRAFLHVGLGARLGRHQSGGSDQH